MTTSDFITLGGAAITLISMYITIRQAQSARTYSNNAKKSSQDAKAAMTAVQLAAVAERLKSAQEHIRDVAPQRILIRGVKIDERFDLIRREFDLALSALPKAGTGSEARKILTNAQAKLNIYRVSLPSQPDQDTWQSLQIFVQDTISDLTSTTTSIGALDE